MLLLITIPLMVALFFLGHLCKIHYAYVKAGRAIRGVGDTASAVTGIRGNAKLNGMLDRAGFTDKQERATLMTGFLAYAGSGALLVFNIFYLLILLVFLISMFIPATLVNTGIIGGGGVSGGGGGTSQAQGTASEEAGDKDKDSGGSSVPVSGDSSAPPGTDMAHWESGDELGRVLAKTAFTASIMKFPEAGNPADATPAGGLRYEQGNTPIGVYDCSVFVTAVLEANGYRVDGGKREGDKYDFNTMKKSDLAFYQTTYGMADVWGGMGIKPRTTLGAPGWDNEVKPGDIILTSSHVGVIVGKNEAGDVVMAHAASSGATWIFTDMAGTKQTQDVGLNKGISELNQIVPGGAIYRPSDFIK